MSVSGLLTVAYERSRLPVMRAPASARPLGWMYCAGCGSLTSHAMNSAGTVRSAPQLSPWAGLLAALSGSSVGPNHGTSRSGAECSSFLSATLRGAPNFCCAIVSSTSAGLVEALRVRDVAPCAPAANESDVTRMSNKIANAATIAFRAMNIDWINASGPLDQLRPLALERGLWPSVDMARQRGGRLGTATGPDQRHQMRFGKNAALLVASSNTCHVVENRLQERRC